MEIRFPSSLRNGQINQNLSAELNLSEEALADLSEVTSEGIEAQMDNMDALAELSQLVSDLAERG